MQGAVGPASSTWCLGAPPPEPTAWGWMRHGPHAMSLAWGDLGAPRGRGCRESQRRAPRVCQSCALPSVIPCICFLELSKSQNDMTSDKQLLATGPRQCASRTERRSQSDTAINVTTRVLPEAARPPPELLLVHFRGRFSFPFLLLRNTKQSEGKHYYKPLSVGEAWPNEGQIPGSIWKIAQSREKLQPHSEPLGFWLSTGTPCWSPGHAKGRVATCRAETCQVIPGV